VFGNNRTLTPKKFRHLRLIQPHRILIQLHLQSRIAVLGLINNNLTHDVPPSASISSRLSASRVSTTLVSTVKYRIPISREF
jgi:hypothetical protein